METYNAVNNELARGASISIIELVAQLVEEAYARRASDIHIDPLQAAMRVRFRIDGVLQDAYTFPSTIKSEVISRIKVLSSLRTDEHNAMHDGRFRYMLKDNTSVDVRVSIAPTYYGENAVLRLLSDNAEHFTLDNLGFNQSDRKAIVDALHKPSGMILVTGPTGSGKTTTLYTLIQMINNNENSVVTIEDPIEYAINGIRQIQVNHRSGLTFASGLKTILRQDPNVIMVGEIRDSETASISVNTALTGHLLLSTLHTNDAATTLPRLLDLKVEAFLLASTISIAIGQRLVRKICSQCKVELKIDKAVITSLKTLTMKEPLKVGENVYEGKGCENCGGTGYKGRICINEVLIANQDIRDAISKSATANEIKKIAIKHGMRTMVDDGFDKVRNGETTIKEVLRIIHD